MNALVLLAEAGSENPVTQIARTFGVDWPHLIAQAISFSIVCLLLYFFAYKRVLAVLEERRRNIAQGLADAEESKAERARAEAQRQDIIMQANAHAASLIQGAHEAAARVQDRETQKAIAAAEEIIAKAREAAAREHALMLAQLRREVGHLVVQTTATVTGKVLTPDDQRRLVDETAAHISA
jgi:F-type H+-transporting ATPase subunit b